MPREGGQSGVLRKLKEPIKLRQLGRGLFHSREELSAAVFLLEQDE